MEISKKDLFEKYGITLEKGLYTVELKDGQYIVNTLRDDTSGCILVGNKLNGSLIQYSTVAYNKIFTLIKKILKTSDLQIVITNPVKQDILPDEVINLPIQKQEEWTETYSPDLLEPISNSSVQQSFQTLETPQSKNSLNQSWLSLLKQLIYWLTKTLTTRSK